MKKGKQQTKKIKKKKIKESIKRMKEYRAKDAAKMFAKIFLTLNFHPVHAFYNMDWRVVASTNKHQ